MIVYRIASKVPEVDIEEQVEAVSSLKEAKKAFAAKVSQIQNCYPEEPAWCELTKIKLSERLTHKQLILAIMSRSGFASKQETLDSWST